MNAHQAEMDLELHGAVESTWFNAFFLQTLRKL